ncbi:hypothetical protein EGI32_15460 [Ferruginibacter sp. HRS2-29]|nr:hypothetical protein [Ferruginibacter sp. HRS2-29]
MGVGQPVGQLVWHSAILFLCSQKGNNGSQQLIEHIKRIKIKSEKTVTGGGTHDEPLTICE